MHSKKTYALDTMARMMPHTRTRYRPPVFRLEAVLTEAVDPAPLQQAVNDLAPRFPIMYTRLRRGFIWHYLEDAREFAFVGEDNGVPCRIFDLRDKNTPLLRVLYKENRLSVEAGHLTADICAVTYFSTLLARYFELQGYETQTNRHILNYLDTPEETELTDFFPVVYEKQEKKKSLLEPPVFRYLPKCTGRRITNVQIPVDALKVLLKEKYAGCTVTEYLNAVYSCAFLKLYEKSRAKKKRRPVKMCLMADLRNYWDTNTQRNFVGSVFANVVPEKEDYDIHDVLEIIRRETKDGLTKEKMTEFVSHNVDHLKPMNFVPGFLKSFLVRAGAPFGRFVWPYTSSISNVGYVRLPDSFAGHVKSFALMVGGFELSQNNCAIVGVNNLLTMSFTAVNTCTEIEDFCVGFLQKDGLQVAKGRSYPC